jgi:hypothetical protein
MIWKWAVASEGTGEGVGISQSDPLCEGATVAEASEEDVFGIDMEGLGDLFDRLECTFFD